MSFGYFPQALRIWRDKSAADISILTYAIFSVGTAIWLTYGFVTGDPVIIASFAVGVIGSWLVLGLTLYFRRR